MDTQGSEGSARQWRQWFRHPAAMTGNKSECTSYAHEFARDQAGTGGTRILVMTRGGNVVLDISVQEAIQ